MKKIVLIATTLNMLWFVSACSPIVQGVVAIGSVISVSSDRRSTGTILDDKALSVKLDTWAFSDPKLKEDAHLNFLVYNQTVLMTGEVTNAAIRTYAEQRALATAPQIKRIFNEILIASVSNLPSRVQDAIITGKVKLSFQNQEVFNPAHIQVMTENNTVYLMGMVTEREAKKAASVAARTGNVDKVVKIFDYLKTRPAAEIERDRLRKLKADQETELEQKKAVLEAKKTKLQQQIDALNKEGGTQF